MVTVSHPQPSHCCFFVILNTHHYCYRMAATAQHTKHQFHLHSFTNHKHLSMANPVLDGWYQMFSGTVYCPRFTLTFFHVNKTSKEVYNNTVLSSNSQTTMTHQTFEYECMFFLLFYPSTNWQNCPWQKNNNVKRDLQKLSDQNMLLCTIFDHITTLPLNS